MIQYFIKDLGLQILKEGQFSLIHPASNDVLFDFDKGTEHQCIEISWSLNLLKQAAAFFPFLQTALPKFDEGKVFSFQKAGKNANRQALGLINDLLNAPFDEEVSKLYFEHKVREYLILLLVESGKIPTAKISLTKEETEKIENLAHAMRTAMAKKFPISKLATQIGMNEMKLKMAFKQRYGLGIFEFQLEARMKEAHRMLEENELSTKAIASRVGYRLTTSFISKFREYFGYTPGTITRRK